MLASIIVYRIYHLHLACTIFTTTLSVLLTIPTVYVRVKCAIPFSGFVIKYIILLSPANFLAGI